MTISIGTGGNFPVTIPDDTNPSEVASITNALTLMYQGVGGDPGIEDHLNTLDQKLSNLGTSNLSITTGTWIYKNSEIVNNSTLTSTVAAEASSRGTAITALNTSLTTLINLLVPIGSIIMWSGHGGTQPGTGALANWRLCTGGSPVNGVVIPDLRNKFIYGSNDYATTTAGGTAGRIGREGGIDQLTIGAANLPKHTHSWSTTNTGGHSHPLTKSAPVNATIRSTYRYMNYSGSTAGNYWVNGAYKSGGDWQDTVHEWNPSSFGVSVDANTGTHSHSGTTGDGDTTGGAFANTPMDNKPPYITLGFIIRVA